MQTLEIIEFKNQRLLTTEQLAEFYGASAKNIRDNFSNNREKFIEGKHYFRLEGEELKAFKNDTENFGIVGNRVNQLILYTKQGASRHSKMLGTNRAWDMFDELEENYFNPMIKTNMLPTDPMEILQLTFEAQKQANEKLDSVDTRVTELEENAPLSPGDYGHISRLVNQRVSTVISERHLKLTQKQRSQLYKDLNAEIKAVMRVPSRTQLRQRHYNDTIDFILNWQPSSATIAIVNQLSIEEFTDIA